MRSAFSRHWPEYLMEAALLGLFMISAAAFTTLLAHPASPLARVFHSNLSRRAAIGMAMGLTAITLTYSPFGKQSGAHYNPAVTIAFLRLGKIKAWDATFYILFQFLGGLCGVELALFLLRDLLRMPPITYVETLPGSSGVWSAFLAEFCISFLLMSTVLFAINRTQIARFTPLFAGSLVVLFITFEAPFSGMSMNPARSFASAAAAALWSSLWIYFLAPVFGMLVAAEVRRFLFPGRTNACPKLHHENKQRCIFCGRGVAVALALLLAAMRLPAQNNGPMVGPIAITVSDLNQTVAFFVDTLAFEKESETNARFDSFDRLTGIFGTNVKVATLRLGDERIELLQYVTPQGRAYPRDSHSNDDWFQHIAIVVSDMNAAYDKLRARHVEQISTEPQTLPQWNRNAAGVKAFYFRDPDRHPLELIYFPADKGDPRWHRPTSKIFLGIDHTAIAVENTERSLRFYRDLLGFHVAAESLNYGIEQEHLNHTFGSRVRITGLRASAGPGVEFLEYEAPRDGRPFPADSHANDLWNVNTTLLVDKLSLLGEQMHLIPEAARPLADTDGFFLRDPDGHRLLIGQLN